ncbi:MAG: thrombospondin type 3 repeat-containing protein, partial [Planctomycetota bacterium]
TLGFRWSSGGGGGGTGVLYQAPGSTTWEPLMVAGGGGGAAAGMSFGFCHNNKTGRDASLVPTGAAGGDDTYKGTPGFVGGLNGNGGDGGVYLSAGGGGYYSDATHYGEVVTDPNLLARIGRAGHPAGAAGGVPPNDEVLDNEGRGGWGCGSGGAGLAGWNNGAGGGGWSGGGAGAPHPSLTGGGGGGGGSWIDPRAVGPMIVTHAVPTSGLFSEPDDGLATLTHLPLTDGDFCGQAIEIYAPVTQFHFENLTALGGATQSALVSCQGLSPLPDRWYTYVNDLPVARELVFSAGNGPMWVEHYASCGGVSYGCGSAWEPTSTLTARFTLEPGERGYFRVEAPPLGFGDGEADFGVLFTAVGPDADGDGIVDFLDNCNLDWNNSQTDGDGDGVGNECDICPGGDDAVDSDGDGVPDFCDQCPGSDDFADMDGDGVPDACDSCIGDNSQDADGDGIPDACDPCDGPDCDGNGLGDLCDLAAPGRLSTFELDAYNPDTIDLDNGDFLPKLENGRLVLLDSTADLTGTAIFAPVAPTETIHFEFEAWLRIESDAFLSPVSLYVFRDDQALSGAALDPLSPTGSLRVQLGNPVLPEAIQVYWNNQDQIALSAPFDWNDGQWHRLRLLVDDGLLSIEVQDPGQAPVTLFTDFETSISDVE